MGCAIDYRLLDIKEANLQVWVVPGLLHYLVAKANSFDDNGWFTFVIMPKF